MDKTKIDWCDSTWNPVTGCLYGCEYCYARNIAKRFGGANDGEIDYEGEALWTFEGEENGENHVIEMPYNFYSEDGEKVRKSPYPYYFDPTFHKYKLNEYENKKGRNIFVCSMADLFGDWVPDDWIKEVFAACEKVPQHNYLFLTKNPGRYVELINTGNLLGSNNVWYGYSVTKKGSAEWWNPDYNIFASVEPILEPMDVPRCKWLIIGAETGNRKDKVIPKREWIEDIVNQCRESKIPVFMKSSLADIWGETLIQEIPKALQHMEGKK